MVCSPPGSSVHGILQARILEWVAISSFRGSSQPRDRTCLSYTGRQILYHRATWETSSAPTLTLFKGAAHPPLRKQAREPVTCFPDEALPEFFILPLIHLLIKESKNLGQYKCLQH